MEDTNKPISEMNDEEFQKLQTDVANGKENHFKEEIEEDSEENKNTDKSEDSKSEDSKSEEDSKQEDNKETNGQKVKEDDKDKEDEDKEDKDEPKVRKSKKDYIIERLQKKANKKTSEEDDDEINPNDRKLVEDVVEEKIGNTIEELKKITLEQEEEKERVQEEAEVEKFCTENEKFAPYKSKILKFWRHETRRHLPLKTIAYEVAGDDLIMIGAKQQREADKAAKSTSTGSDSKLATIDKTVAEMSDAEFEEYQNRVLHPKQ